MTHRVELILHQFMQDASNGKAPMSEDNINTITKDIKEALHRQFGSKTKNDKFTLRMSNLGRPTCQLWYLKNKPGASVAKPSNFIMNMMIGDIVEAIFKGLLREAGVTFKDSSKVNLTLSNTDISGTYDLVLDDAVDDVKSASDWSYRNKFESYEALSSGDSFGYIGQLAGYAKAMNKKPGGWWVINKANGKFKYVPASGLDIKKEVSKLKETVKVHESNVFKRCFEAVDETFRGKPTGNKVLGTTCSFCDFKHDCWENLEERPAIMSKAQFPKMVSYVSISEEYKDVR
tara:strand:- start:573 stop:1439 length:867 start_codon:yes stop_codon:yes gene_type:complete